MSTLIEEKRLCAEKVELTQWGEEEEGEELKQWVEGVEGLAEQADTLYYLPGTESEEVVTVARKQTIDKWKETLLRRKVRVGTTPL